MQFSKNRHLRHGSRQLLSYPIVRSAASAHFAAVYSDRAQLLSDLKQLDAKYAGIGLQMQIQTTPKQRSELSEAEIQIITITLERIQMGTRWYVGNLKKGAIDAVLTELKSARVKQLLESEDSNQEPTIHERTRYSIIHHINELRKKFGDTHKKRQSTPRGSPEPNVDFNI